MPVFINEVVFRGNVQRETSGGGDAAAANPEMAEGRARRQALVDEVTQAVLDRLERELDRIGER